MQLGSQNYRKKGKKSDRDGLRPNFQFETTKADASLNRILGNVKASR